MAQVQASGTARGTQLYALIAVFGLSIAAVSVMATTVHQRAERRREAASLRVVGVPATEVAGGYRAEAQALGVAITVVTAIAVWIGCWALLGALPLVDPGQFGLPFEATPDARLVLSLAVASGGLVGLVVFLGLHMVARSSPPSMLRDDAG
jgi:ABC-type antimicrobial peptide transport system permease subunit